MLIKTCAMHRLLCLCWYVFVLLFVALPPERAPTKPAFVLQNAFVGWYQEKAAGDIVEQLKSGIALKATVIREGQEKEIEARDIVPGDICVIEVRCDLKESC